MIPKISSILLFVVLFLLASGCEEKSAKDKTELVVSAAISMKDALQEIKIQYEQDFPNVFITYNMGGSGNLARQIEQGAPADIFVSASQADMDNLQGKNKIVPATRSDVLKNRLALIASKGSGISRLSFEDLSQAEFRHFAIGQPESVPAGRYAKQLLEGLNLWELLQGKLVFAKDVRQVLAYVESGNAELGIVYESDTLISDRIQVMGLADPDWHQPIVYPAAVITGSSHEEEAKQFIQYLLSPDAKNIFKKYGFQP